MKAGIQINAKSDDSVTRTRIDESEVYFRVRRELHQVAAAAGLKSIEDFVSEDPEYLLQNGMLDEDDEEDRRLFDEECYFSPGDAVPIIELLIRHAEGNQGAMYMAKCLRFLRSLHEEIANVSERNQDFHLTFEIGAM